MNSLNMDAYLDTIELDEIMAYAQLPLRLEYDVSLPGLCSQIQWKQQPPCEHVYRALYYTDS